jgi:peptidoglycan/xylan/chitin deacetylase (PgdA/CDA1 family)
MAHISVIAYHKISDKLDFGINAVKVSHFKKHLALLAENGYKPTTFRRIQQGEPVSQKSIVIAFDDGYDACYTKAAPLLLTYNFPAVIFPITRYIGMRNTWEPFFLQRHFKHLTGKQLIELSDLGFEIGSHGSTHRYLPLLKANALRAEINDSKTALEDLLGRDVTTFCYPYGQYNARIVACVQNAGYKYALAAPRIFFKPDKSNFTIVKQSIYATDSLYMIGKKINKPETFSWPTISQWLIQKGSFASIALNIIKNNRYLA